MPTKTNRWILALMAVLLAAPPAFALIAELLPLQNIIRSSRYIVVAKVEKLYADKPAMMLAVAGAMSSRSIVDARAMCSMSAFIPPSN